MKPFSAVQKTLLGCTVLLSFGLAAVLSGGSNSEEAARNAAPKAGPSDHIMFGGTIARNMLNTIDKNVPEKVDVRSDQLLWKADLGNLAYGGPIISGGKIYVGTNNERPRNKRDIDKAGDAIDRGILMCFEEKTGQFLWQAVHNKLPSGLVNDWPKEGICSAPAIEGNNVYYVSNRCSVVCADANGFADGNQGMQTEQYQTPIDADILWEYDMIKELNVFPHNLAVCSPLIIGDIVFIVTANGVDEGHINIPSPEAPSFIALDKKSGKLLWKRADPGKNIMHGQWSNPVFAEINGVPQVIFPGGDGWLYSFAPQSGDLIWKFDCNPKDAVYALGGLGTKNDFIGTPVVVDNKVYIGVGQDPEHSSGIANFFCISPTGKGDISKTLLTGKKLADGKLEEKPNPNSGEVWRYGWIEDRQWAPRDYKFGRTMSTACVIDDLVYISELQGYLHCLDAKTGKHFWIFDTKSSIWGSPYFVDDKIMLGTDAGELYVFKHDRKQEVIDEVEQAKNAPNMKAAREIHKRVRSEIEKKFLLSVNEMDAAVRSTPVVANGVIYVMTEKSLYALKCK